MTSCVSLEVVWVDCSPDGPGSSSKDNDELTELLLSSVPNTVFVAISWSYIKHIIHLNSLHVVFIFDHCEAIFFLQ